VAADLNVEVDVIAQVKPPDQFDVGQLGALVRFALEAENAHGDWAVAAVLTSDEELRKLHRDYMGVDTKTDVMTFPAENEFATEDRGGDIVISVDRAADQALEFDTSPWDEIRFLAIHGVLHLLGWNDRTDDERAAMHVRQRGLIDAFDRLAIRSGDRL
jgi:probable rRNA maturation factor